MEVKNAGLTELSKRVLSESDSATLKNMPDDESKRLVQWLVSLARIIDDALEASTEEPTIAPDEITTIYPKITIDYTDFDGATLSEVHNSLEWRIIADNCMQQAGNIVANVRLQQHYSPLIGKALTSRMKVFSS